MLNIEYYELCLCFPCIRIWQDNLIMRAKLLNCYILRVSPPKNFYLFFCVLIKNFFFFLILNE